MEQETAKRTAAQRSGFAWLAGQQISWCFWTTSAACERIGKDIDLDQRLKLLFMLIH